MDRHYLYIANREVRLAVHPLWDFRKGKSMKNTTNTESNTTSNPKRQLWTVLALTMLTGAGVTLSACNTVEGVGRDVEAAGDGIADTAEDAKD